MNRHIFVGITALFAILMSISAGITNLYPDENP